MHDWNNNYGHGDGSHIFMMVIMIAVITLFVWALITFARRNGVFSAATSAESPAQSAQSILNDRLARGEISEDEFKSRSAALKSI